MSPTVVRGVERVGDRAEDRAGCDPASSSSDRIISFSVGPRTSRIARKSPCSVSPGLVDRDDVRVVEGRLELALAAEPLAEAGIVAELGETGP